KIALLGAPSPGREARDREACARADPNRAGRRVRPQNHRFQQFEPFSPPNRKKTNPVAGAITPRPRVGRRRRFGLTRNFGSITFQSARHRWLMTPLTRSGPGIASFFPPDHELGARLDDSGHGS